MPVVTDIKQQQRLKGRFSIYVDGRYGFSLSDTALLDSRLTVGQEMTGEELKTYKQLSLDDKVYANALRYAAMRLRSRWELESYLQRKQASPALATQILEKLEAIGMIDDLAFAKTWVDNRHLLKPTSKRKLQQELRAKHVANDIISQVLQADETDDRQSLRQLVDRKRRQSKYQDDMKLMQYLSRQGFSYDDIKHVLQTDD